jgi:hypothetical protein
MEAVEQSGLDDFAVLRPRRGKLPRFTYRRCRQADALRSFAV